MSQDTQLNANASVPNRVPTTETVEAKPPATGNDAVSKPFSRKHSRSRITARHLSQHMRQSTAEQFFAMRSVEAVADAVELPTRTVSDCVHLDLHRRLLQIENMRRPMASEGRLDFGDKRRA